MELLLIRKEFSKNSTIGELFINGEFFCYTLEDFDRDLNKDGDLLDSGEQKVNAATAIPRGTYKVSLSMSNRFKKYLPELHNVPGFVGVRIHNGNHKDHTEGCILVGSTKAKDFIGNSVATMLKLMNRLEKVEKTEKISITIK